MKVLFRADASIKIGTGHIMRCLTLAHLLKNEGARAVFVCSEIPGNLIEFIRQEGFEVFPIIDKLNHFQDASATFKIAESEKADLIIVDHYSLNVEWEAILRNGLFKIMVIDDLANREHDCDILLDQNYFLNYERRYEGLVPRSCRTLLGPSHLLLRPEFYETQVVRQRENGINNLLIFYGGSDPTNETVKALIALSDIELTNLHIHVVVGESNQEKDHIQYICKEKNYHFYKQIDYIADLMGRADLALGAGGVTMWERCFLGLPSIVTIVAENQKESSEAAAAFGAVWNLGWHEAVKGSNIVDILKRALKSPKSLQEMSNKAKQLTHAKQIHKIHPVVEAILEVLDK